MAAPGRQHLLATFAVAGVAWRLQRFRPRAPAQQVNEDRSEEVLPRADARARLPGLVSAAAHFVGAVRIPGASPVTRTAVLLRGKVGVGRVRGAATHDAQRCRQECRLCRRVQVFHWSRERESALGSLWRPSGLAATGRAETWALRSTFECEAYPQPDEYGTARAIDPGQGLGPRA